MITRIARAIDSGFNAASEVLHRIGNVVLMFTMLLTAADVILRLVKHPIMGAFDITEYMMAILVAFSLAYCSINKGHVSVDFVMRHLSAFVQDIIGIITTFTSFALVAIMAYWSMLQMITQYTTGVTSSVLPIPQYPFVGTVALGLFMLTLVLLAEVIKRIAHTAAKSEGLENVAEVTY
ncbi:MAG: TRAP transporter small permease [Dehalococcoidia bacterium]|nr:TRAP transporter small permease [Dehalococcoidia bacterium]